MSITVPIPPVDIVVYAPTTGRNLAGDNVGKLCCEEERAVIPASGSKWKEGMGGG